MTGSNFLLTRGQTKPTYLPSKLYKYINIYPISVPLLAQEQVKNAIYCHYLVINEMKDTNDGIESEMHW